MKVLVTAGKWSWGESTTDWCFPWSSGISPSLPIATVVATHHDAGRRSRPWHVVEHPAPPLRPSPSVLSSTPGDRRSVSEQPRYRPGGLARRDEHDRRICTRPAGESTWCSVRIQNQEEPHSLSQRLEGGPHGHAVHPLLRFTPTPGRGRTGPGPTPSAGVPGRHRPDDGYLDSCVPPSTCPPAGGRQRPGLERSLTVCEAFSSPARLDRPTECRPGSRSLRRCCRRRRPRRSTGRSRVATRSGTTRCSRWRPGTQ